MTKSLFELSVSAIEMETAERLNLDDVSSSYHNSYQKVLEYQEQIRKALPSEMHEMLEQLECEYDMLQAYEGDMYYRHGFSDAIRLLMQALTWEPARG